jgi:NAD(P)-dependent dehydrogenase (short-subunit alcohol dehydrogenase family)
MYRAALYGKGPELMTKNPFDLKGKVALITGSTIGIGEGTARVLGRAGAHVIISSRKQPDCDRVAAELRDEGISAEGRACLIGGWKTSPRCRSACANGMVAWTCW